jgi:hypothetical protein
MPNWTYTSFKLIGPEADIERFKRAYLYAEPVNSDNGIDFSRVGVKTPTVRLSCYQVDPEGRHDFYLSSANTFPREALIKMAEQFPSLTMAEFHAGDGEGGGFFCKGSIRAGAVNLVEDADAAREFDDAMRAAS